MSRDAIIRACVEKEKNREDTGDLVASFADLARYSGLHRDLKEQHVMFTRGAAKLDEELAATIAGLGKELVGDGPGSIAMIERSLVLAFKGLQKDTAFKVIKRVLKDIEMVDASTMMGHDMFTEERINFEATIYQLREVIEEREK